MSDRYEAKNIGMKSARMCAPEKGRHAGGECGTNELTERQGGIMECISGFMEEHGFSPTVREIQTLTGYRSTSSVHAQLHKLADMGMLSYEPTKPRTIVILRNPRGEWESGRSVTAVRQ